MKRSFIGAIIAAALLVAPVAHAQTDYAQIGDPYTDTLQLWSEIASALSSLGNDVASVFGHQLSSEPTASTQQGPASLAAVAGSFNNAGAPTNTATSTEPAATTTSAPTTVSKNVAATQSNPPLASILSNPTPAFDASDFVSQSELSSLLLTLRNSLAAQMGTGNTAAPSQNVAADGNAAIPYAAENDIGSLPNVTITNANLTASEIPALNYFPSTSTISITYGGTGISNSPTFGQLLLGNGSGGYNLVSTSSLGIVSGGGSASTTLLSDNNTFTGSNTFSSLLTLTNGLISNASSTFTSTLNANTLNLINALGVGSGGTGVSSTPSYGQLLLGNGTNYTLTATSSLGLPTFANLSASIGAAYPFALTGNATSTLTQFNAGLTAYASSTIGNGGAKGLTINGTATTTGTAYFAGNVGIGTTSPGSIFSVNNILNLTSATSTLYSTGGINLTAGCFSINGICVGVSGGTLSGGTAGMLAAWTSGSSLTATSTPTVASIVATSTTATSSFAGAISIGNGTGQFTLSMKDAGSGTDTFSVPTLRSTLANSVTAMDIIPNGTPSAVGSHLAWNDICDTDILGADGSQETQCLDLAAGSSAMYVGALAYGVTPTKPLVFLYGSWPGTQAMEINTSGEVGIGNSYAPTQLFDVDGAFVVTSGGQVAIGANTPYTSGGALDITKNSTYTTENAGITIGTGNTNNGQPELLMGVDNTNNIAYIQSGARGVSFTTKPLVLNPNGGLVGVGTTTPYSPLQVTGPNTASTSAFAVVNSASTTVFSVFDDGNSTYSGSIFQSSDQRLKTDVTSLDASSSLSRDRTTQSCFLPAHRPTRHRREPRLHRATGPNRIS
ncbi:MAG: hypothetical protein WB760_04045 [Xanthobacteraceae bacterium]